MLHSRSDSGEAGTPEEEGRGGLLAAIARAVRAAPPIATSIAHAAAAHAAATPHDDDASDDNSADLLDSETEPCLVTDPGELSAYVTTKLTRLPPKYHDTRYMLITTDFKTWALLLARKVIELYK